MTLGLGVATAVVLLAWLWWPRRQRVPQDDQVRDMSERVKRWNRTSRWTRLP